MPFKPNLSSTSQEAEENCDVISHSCRNNPMVKEGECSQYTYRSIESGQLYRSKDALKSLPNIGTNSHASTVSENSIYLKESNPNTKANQIA